MMNGNNYELICHRHSFNSRKLRMQTVSLILLLGALFFSAVQLNAQATGDYQTAASLTDANWSTVANWERYDGASFVAATAYPGQSSGDAQTVTIRSTGNPALTLDVSPAFSIVDLAIQDGTATELDMNGQSLAITGNLTVDGDLLDNAGPGTITLGGNFTINSTATYGIGGAVSNIDFNGTGTQTISGSFTGTAEFSQFNKSASGTLDNNLAATMQITGQMLQSSGTIQAGSATYVLGFGTTNGYCFDKSGGTFTEETSTFRVTSSVDIRMRTDANITFYNLTHSPGISRKITFDKTGGTSFTVSNIYERGGSSSATQFLNSTTLVYGASATLKYTVASNVNVSGEWPSSSGPPTIENSATANVILLSFNRTVSGTLNLKQTSGNLQVNGTSVLTINGTLSRQSTGTVGITVGTGSIVYGTSSTLDYSITSNANVTVGNEWTSTLTPANVRVSHGGSSNKTVTLPNANMAVTNDLNIAAGILAAGNGANTMSVGGNVTTGTLTTAGSFTVGTIEMTNDQSQLISGGAGTLSNLRINKTLSTHTVTVQSNTLTIASGGLLDIQQGIFIMSPGATSLDVSGATLRIQSNGTYRTGGRTITTTGGSTLDFQSGSTYEFNGISTTESFITSGATTNYGNVIINNTNATPSVTVPAGKLIVVQNNLTLTLGQILSGATNSSGDIEVDGSASSSGTSYVNGTLRFKFPSGANSRDFPVGFSSNYRPATFAYTANSVATSIIEIEALSGDPGGTPPSGIAVIATSHYYTVKEVGTGGTFTYGLTLTTTGTGFVPVSRNKILIQNGATPDYSFPTQGTASGSIQSVSGLTVLPTNAFKVAFGAGGTVKRWDGTSGNWSVATNWEDDALPLNGDEILLNNALQASAYTATYNTSTTATTFTKITISATAGVTLQLDKVTTIDLTDGTTGLDISDDADSRLVYNGTSIGFAGGGYDAAKTTIGAASTVEFRTGTVYADDYGNLTVNTTGSLSSTGATTVASGYTKSGAGSHDVSNTTFSVTGTSDIQAGTFSTSGTGSVSLGAVTNSATMTVSGSGASSMGAVTNTSVMTLSSTAGTITLSGNYSGSGTLSATSSTPAVTFQANFSPGGNVTFGSQTLQFQGDVTLTGGSLTLSSNSSFTGNSKDFEISGGSVVTSAGTMSFVTGTSQTITGNVTFPSLTINNSNGVTITTGSLPTVTGTLTLTSGLVNYANAADYLTLNSAASIAGGSGTSFVNGKLRRIFSSTATNLTFQVGKPDLEVPPANRYQPVNFQGSSVSGNPSITIEQFETNDSIPLLSGINSPLVKVSRVRYWAMAFAANGGSFTNPMIRLTWDNSGPAGFSDGVASAGGASTSGDVVIAQQSNGAGNWSSAGQSAFSGSYAVQPNSNAGTLTSSVITLTDGNTDFMTFGAINGAAGLDVSLPVELSSFEAVELANLGNVKLDWKTESEIENAYWLVQKKTGEGTFQTIQTVRGQGTKTSATSYSYLDAAVKPGDSVTYRLADVAYDGALYYHFEKGLRISVPTKFELLPNFPNPFNPSTTIAYKLPAQSTVRLAVYNMLGQKVRELVRNQVQQVGIQKVVWDGRNEQGQSVSSGIYIYRLEAGSFRISRKMTFLK